MAVNCTSSTQIPLQKYGSFIKYTNKELMSKRSYVPPKKAPVLRITASIKNKVYEDQSQGIVCYKDESGETICEGCDEGPRFQRISRRTHHARDFARFRDVQIMNLLLQQSWLQIVKGEEINDAFKRICLQEDFKLQWL